MEIKAVACALPNPDYFMVFHSHTDPRKAVWSSEDQNKFFRLRDILILLHGSKQERENLTREQSEALMPEGVTLDDALQALTPCIVDANRTTKNASYLHRQRDSAQVAHLAGLEGPFGIRFVAIVKKAVGLRPNDWLLGHITRLGKLQVSGTEKSGRPNLVSIQDGSAVDVDSLDFRSSPLMVSLARRYHSADCLLEGKLKVVSLPLNENVKLSANKGGEVVRQIAKEWG